MGPRIYLPRVLVVDDEPEIVRIVAEALTAAGYEVVTAVGSQASLSLIAAEVFDVAIVDYDMPDPDGLELLRRLRHHQSRCLRILMSGKLDLPVVLNAVNDGEVARVLTKPFALADLVSSVNDAVLARGHLERLILDDDSRLHPAVDRATVEELLSGSALDLAMQPIVNAQDRTVVAYEALLVSKHPTLDTATKILKAVEQHELVHELADTVAQRVLGWLQRLPDPLLLFMNVHPLELCQKTQLLARAEQLRPWAERLVFEITERCYFIELDDWAQSVEALGQGGFKIAVDDLGSGYSSLAVLAALQPQFIKIDMSIVRSVHQHARKRRLIALLSRFARATRAKLIAEGVETAEEAYALRECGTDYLQGYLFGRPSRQLLPATE